MCSVCTVELRVTSNNVNIFIYNTAVLLRLICVASCSNAYFGLPVKFSIFLVQFEPDLVEFIDRFFSLRVKFQENPSNGSGIDTCGQTDMMTLIFVFHDFANASENYFFRQERVPHREHTAR